METCHLFEYDVQTNAMVLPLLPFKALAPWVERAALLGAALAALLCLSCERQVVLGDEGSGVSDDLGGASGVATGGQNSPGPGADFGVGAGFGAGAFPSTGGGVGTGGSSPAEPPTLPLGRLVFWSDFETGDLSEWGIPQSSLFLIGGTLEVVDNEAASGSHSLLITATESNRRLVLTTERTWYELVVGFWVRIDAAHTASHWVLLNIDGRPANDFSSPFTDLWDIDVEGTADGSYRPFVWHLGGPGGKLGESPQTFGVGEWVQLQVHLRASAANDGFLRVYQNGKLAVDLSALPTTFGGQLSFSLGSVVASISPLPAEIRFDDVTIHIP